MRATSNRTMSISRAIMASMLLLFTLLLTTHLAAGQKEATSAAATNKTGTEVAGWTRVVSRRNRHPTGASTESPITAVAAGSEHHCEIRDLMKGLHDRVSILATLDEAQRSRLESIDKRLLQFEESDIARLESLKTMQRDFHQQLENVEHLQRMMKHELEKKLGGEFDEAQILKDITNLEITTTDLNGTRVARQTEATGPWQGSALQSARQTARQTSPAQPTAAAAPAAAPDNRHLEALAILLTSTRSAIYDLQEELRANLSRVMQVNSHLQRRLNHLQKRVGGGNGGGGGALAPGYLPPAVYNPAANQAQLVTSCAQGVPTTNGILMLRLTPNSEPFYVQCEDGLFGGGWTVIQNRFNGDENFQRGWAEYKSGFGNLAGEFFIGLEKLHALTASAVHELLIALEDFDGMRRYARYNLFAIGGESETYALNLLGAYSGDAGDALTYHAGSKFSTFDNDNDGCVDCNCAQSHMGAWWYNWCEMSNLNGKYHQAEDKVTQYQGVYWHHFRGPYYSLRAVQMLIRPVVAELENQRRR